MPDEPGVTITLKDIYVELRNLQAQVGAMSPQATTIGDHEKRLRLLERWRYALPGSLALAFASLVIAIIEAHP